MSDSSPLHGVGPGPPPWCRLPLAGALQPQQSSTRRNRFFFWTHKNIGATSFAFGPFSGLILIGNFGDGRVNVFDSSGEFVGQLRDSRGKTLVIDGLWMITRGGGAKSSPDTVYFTAGPNGETDGLLGVIVPVYDTNRGNQDNQGNNQQN